MANRNRLTNNNDVNTDDLFFNNWNFNSRFHHSSIHYYGTTWWISLLNLVGIYFFHHSFRYVSEFMILSKLILFIHTYTQVMAMKMNCNQHTHTHTRGNFHQWKIKQVFISKQPHLHYHQIYSQYNWYENQFNVDEKKNLKEKFFFRKKETI